MRWIHRISTAGLATPVLPCLVFCLSDGKHVFGGNNEDYIDPDTRMWVVPAESGKHGRIFFGFGNGFAQGGVNDAGLFFDGLALDHRAVSASGKPPFPGNPGELALAECSTVAEVAALFERYDRGALASAQLLFGDRGGGARPSASASATRTSTRGRSTSSSVASACAKARRPASSSA